MSQSDLQEARQVERRMGLSKNQFLEGVRRILMSSPLPPHINVLMNRFVLYREMAIGKGEYQVGKLSGFESEIGGEAFYFMLMSSSLGPQIKALGDNCGFTGAEVRAEIIQHFHQLTSSVVIREHVSRFVL
jgi:hypothetical protein